MSYLGEDVGRDLTRVMVGVSVAVVLGFIAAVWFGWWLHGGEARQIVTTREIKPRLDIVCEDAGYQICDTVFTYYEN
jgi:hypothetical protein